MINIIENFYSTTQDLLDLSTTCLNTGCGAGIRSDDLSLISPEIYSDFKNFVFSEYKFNDSKYHLDTYLTKHIYDQNFTGRIHIDGRNPNSCQVVKTTYNLVLCGVIFLTPTKDVNSGMCFYNVNDDTNWTEEQEFDITLNQCYTYNKEQLNNYHNNFYETISIKNIQNRFVCWTAGNKHRNFITKKQQERIVQNFYISVV